MVLTRKSLSVGAASPAETKDSKKDDIRLFLVRAGVNLRKLQLIRLPHPKTGTPALFASSEDFEDLFELLHFEEAHRSWFVDDVVVQNGSMFITSKLHHAFILLPYLYKLAQKCFVIVDDVIRDEEFELVNKIAISKRASAVLPLICDCKEVGSAVAVRLNEEKLFEWLKKRIVSLIDAMKTGGEFSKQMLDDEAYLFKYVTTEVVADYLPEQCLRKLALYLGINLTTPEGGENCDGAGGGSASKKAKVDGDVTPLEDYYDPALASATTKQPPKLSMTQKQLQKASAGTKALTSFFTKAPSKT